MSSCQSELFSSSEFPAEFKEGCVKYRSSSSLCLKWALKPTTAHKHNRGLCSFYCRVFQEKTGHFPSVSQASCCNCWSLAQESLTPWSWHKRPCEKKPNRNFKVKSEEGFFPTPSSKCRTFGPYPPPPPSPANFYQPPAAFINFIKYSPSKLGRPF